MEQIAFIYGERLLYWSSILTAMGGAAALFLFAALSLEKTRNWFATAVMIPLAALLSLLLSRLLHWYCCASSYSSFYAAMLDYSAGGYALAGVFAGCVLSAGLLRLLRFWEDLPEVLDILALAGSAGIAIGRLGSLFNASCRGMALPEGSFLAVSSVNSITGQTEYHFGTFLVQAMVAAALFIGLMIFYTARRKPGKALKSGDTCSVFLLLYCASQAVLDSTRYDSLFLRSNGFVSLVQILCALGLVLTAVLFTRRLVRLLRWKSWYFCFWLPQAAALGVAGYMEYYVQRHGDRALFAYSVMSACLLIFVALTLLLRRLAVRAEQQPNILNLT